MDAITGMGEDAYSCGEFAFEMTGDEAAEYSKTHNVDLFAENAEEQG
jgi:hypothetical protein